MPDRNHKEVSIGDRLAIAAIPIGVAGVIGPQFLPPWLVEVFPDSFRIVISIASAVVGVVGIAYCLYHLGETRRWARLLLYGIALLAVLGVDLMLFSSAPAWFRGLVGAASGAAVLIFAPKTFSKFKVPTAVKHEDIPHADAAPTMFDMSDQAEVSVRDLRVRGDTVRFARLSGSAKLTVNNSYVEGPNAPPVELPYPSSDWILLSDEQLKQIIAITVAKLRALDVEFRDGSDNGIEPGSGFSQLSLEEKRAVFQRRSEATAAYYQSYNIRYQTEFLPGIKLVVAAVIVRRPGISIPRATVDLGHDGYVRARSIMLGHTSLESGMAAGRFYSVADYLEYLSSKL